MPMVFEDEDSQMVTVVCWTFTFMLFSVHLLCVKLTCNQDAATIKVKQAVSSEYYMKTSDADATACSVLYFNFPLMFREVKSKNRFFFFFDKSASFEVLNDSLHVRCEFIKSYSSASAPTVSSKTALIGDDLKAKSNLLLYSDVA